jgi:hypothetical protein
VERKKKVEAEEKEKGHMMNYLTNQVSLTMSLLR